MILKSHCNAQLYLMLKDLLISGSVRTRSFWYLQKCTCDTLRCNVDIIVSLQCSWIPISILYTVLQFCLLPLCSLLKVDSIRFGGKFEIFLSTACLNFREFSLSVPPSSFLPERNICPILLLQQLFLCGAQKAQLLNAYLNMAITPPSTSKIQESLDKATLRFFPCGLELTSSLCYPNSLLSTQSLSTEPKLGSSMPEQGWPQNKTLKV